MTIEAAADMIRDQAGSDPLETVIVLDEDFASIMDNSLEGQVTIPYEALPGFPPNRQDRGGHLLIGDFEGERIACLVGREYYYERGDARAMAAPLETLAMLGARTLFLTGLAGSANADIGPASLVCLTDHMNLTGINPLIGLEDSSGSVSLVDAYDPRLVRRMRRAATGSGVGVKEGVYLFLPDPTFATPAEIRLARQFGADVIASSLLPEAILARSLAMRVVCVCAVTHFGAGFMGGNPTLGACRQMALQASISLKRLIRGYFKARDESWGAMGRFAAR